MATPSYLFAYGTLMASAADNALGQQQRLCLQREAHLVGSAHLHGELYDLGHYPGLIERVTVGNPGVLVRGEVWQLHDPAGSLRWLDRYEGIDPVHPQEAEYRRVERTVVLQVADGEQALTAWVYIYVGALAGARHIPAGFWSERTGVKS